MREPATSELPGPRQRVRIGQHAYRGFGDEPANPVSL